MINYTKLAQQEPTVYSTITNSIGQTIQLVEHPTMGDLSEVICICHKLELAAYSGFFDTDDMEGGEDYEPSFKDGVLHIGGVKH